MEGAGAFVAVALPWLVGTLGVARWGPRGDGAWASALGYGYLLGLLATTLSLRAAAAVGLGLSFLPTAFVLCAACGVFLWYGRPFSFPRAPKLRWPRGSREWSLVCILALVALRYGLLGLELITAPMTSWDGWAIWAPRARVWFELRELAPFVGWDAWWAAPGDAYTIDAWHYPATIPLIQTWVCLAMQGWNERLMNLPWLAAAIALGLGFYGQSRAWGVERLSAAAATGLLLSLPLLNTQVAVAGHADLWMTVTYGLASLAFFLWLRDGDPRQGALALTLALACPFVKIPGYVWLATFLPPLVLATRHRVRWLWLLAGGAIVLGFWFPLAGVVGEAGLFMKEGIYLRLEVLGALLRNLFTLASWHLFWYVAVIVLLIEVKSMRNDRTLRLMALQVFLALGFIVGVYSLTRRGLWATDFTQSGRAVLHVVPMLAFLIVALLEKRYGPALIAGPTREHRGEISD